MEADKEQRQGALSFSVRLDGVSPLLLNAIPHNDKSELIAWRKEHPLQSDFVFDDRYPPWSWRYCLYPCDSPDEPIYVPAFVVFASMRMATSIICQRRGKASLTRKLNSLHIEDRRIPILVSGKKVLLSDITTQGDYEEQHRVARRNGLVLFESRVRVGDGVGLRVRPRIDDWALEFTVSVRGSHMDSRELLEIISVAGIEAGICDWRPGSPNRSGNFGRFVGTVDSI